MIWCVDDDSTIRDIEVYTLESTGFKAKGFADGQSMFEALKSEIPDLIVLDIMLPGEDGVEILKKLRQSTVVGDIPVIMATAKGTEMDKIKGLDTGADDYLVKPFGMMEMVSRIKAVLRRCNKETEAEVTPAVVIPETTPAPVETEAPKQPETEVEEPETKSPLENSNILILGAGAIVFALLYYFKIYKPGHEEEEEDDEGIEMGDGLPMEHEE